MNNQTFSQPHSGAPDYEYEPSDYYTDLEIYTERLIQDLFVLHYQSCSGEMRKHLYKAAELRRWSEILPTLKEIDNGIN
jgi:hypothetical protein